MVSGIKTSVAISEYSVKLYGSTVGLRKLTLRLYTGPTARPRFNTFASL